MDNLSKENMTRNKKKIKVNQANTKDVQKNT